MMTPVGDLRGRIAAEQAALVGALIKSGPAPTGFDSLTLHASARSLVEKRIVAVARSLPTLAEALVPPLVDLFKAYAQANSLPLLGGAIADGRAFVRWLAAENGLPEACRLEALVVDLRYRAIRQGLVPRRWVGLQYAWL